MHHTRSRPVAIWNNATVPNARDFHHWDAAQYSGLDGVNGGTWSPLTPIGIGGNGVTLASASRMAGGFTTKLGGRYLLGANDYPVFSAGNRTRTVTFPVRGLTSDVGIYRTLRFHNPSGRSWAVSGWMDPANATLISPLPQRWIHNGAQLSNLTLAIAIPTVKPVITSNIYQAVLFDCTSSTQWTPTTRWQSVHAFSLGSFITPATPLTQTGLFYKATAVSGSTGSLEPTWPTIVGGTVTDGGITWTAEGSAGTIVGSSYATMQQGIPLSVSITPFATLTLNAAHTYALVINQDSNIWMYASAQMTLTNLADMRFQ